MILVLLVLLESWGWGGQPPRKISGMPVVQTFIHGAEIKAVKQIIIFQWDLWKADFGSTYARTTSNVGVLDLCHWKSILASNYERAALELSKLGLHLHIVKRKQKTIYHHIGQFQPQPQPHNLTLLCMPSVLHFSKARYLCIEKPCLLLQKEFYDS